MSGGRCRHLNGVIKFERRQIKNSELIPLYVPKAIHCAQRELLRHESACSLENKVGHSLVVEFQHQQKQTKEGSRTCSRFLDVDDVSDSQRRSVGRLLALQQQHRRKQKRGRSTKN